MERKDRICITLPKELMEKIDKERSEQIDGITLERATWLKQLVYDHFKKKERKEPRESDLIG